MVLKNKTIERIFELREMKLSIRKIGKKLGISPTSVSCYLKYGKEKAVTLRTVTREKQQGVLKGKEVPVSRTMTPIMDHTRFGADDEIGSMSEMLHKIILEVNPHNISTLAVIRMVEPNICNPACRDFGLSKLAEALNLANFSPGDKKLILRNWSDYVFLR